MKGRTLASRRIATRGGFANVEGGRSILRMKRITIVVVVGITAILAAGLGTRFHAQILSIGDGLSRIDLKKAPTPAGFEVTPETADFIFSSLLKNAWHWGADGTIAAYVDTDSYYILGMIPPNQSYCSYTARVLGTRISGKDGRVFREVSGEWVGKGYIHRFRSDIISTVTNGMSDSDLSTLIGNPFERNVRGIIFKDGDWGDQLHYWSRDGEILIFLKQGKVIGVSTNITFVRI